MLAFVVNIDALDLLSIAAYSLLALLAFWVVQHLTRNNGTPLPWRKVALYAAFVGLGVLFVAGHPLLQYLTNLGVPHAGPGDLNATGAEVEASATASGWVPLGTATSKIIMAATFYVLSYILPWFFQQVTHPQPTEWAKERYKVEFQELASIDKFTVVGRIGMNQSIRWAASLLAAALIV